MNRIRIIIIFFLALSCSKYSNDSVGWDEYDIYDTYVDEYGNEGMVVVKEATDDYKIMIVVSSDETELSWGPVGELVGDFSIDYKFSTYQAWEPIDYILRMNRIVEDMGRSRFPAFEWCQSKNGQEKTIHGSSWMLVGLYELYEIFTLQKEEGELNARLGKAGFAPISGDYYWTCAEDYESIWKFADEEVQNNVDYDPYIRAIPYAYPSSSSRFKSDWAKDKVYKVRAVKYIYYDTRKSD